MNWRPIAEIPDKPMPVVFYSTTRNWWGSDDREWGANGEPFSEKEPYRCERSDIGYWDGNTWRWQGTAHEVWEWPEDDDDPGKPTHWMPLPEPPK